MILRVKATPNASKDEVLGWVDEPLIGKVLRVRIKAPPVEGKANKALAQFLAKSLGLSKSAVKISKGQQSRIKSFVIPDDTTLPSLGGE